MQETWHIRGYLRSGNGIQATPSIFGRASSAKCRLICTIQGRMLPLERLGRRARGRRSSRPHRRLLLRRRLICAIQGRMLPQQRLGRRARGRRNGRPGTIMGLIFSAADQICPWRVGILRIIGMAQRRQRAQSRHRFRRCPERIWALGWIARCGQITRRQDLTCGNIGRWRLRRR